MSYSPCNPGSCANSYRYISVRRGRDAFQAETAMGFLNLPLNFQLIGVGFILILFFIVLAPKKSSTYRGPPGLPFIGNLLDLRSTHPLLKHPGRTFFEWSKQYGEPSPAECNLSLLTQKLRIGYNKSQNSRSFDVGPTFSKGCSGTTSQEVWNLFW